MCPSNLWESSKEKGKRAQLNIYLVKDDAPILTHGAQEEKHVSVPGIQISQNCSLCLPALYSTQVHFAFDASSCHPNSREQKDRKARQGMFRWGHFCFVDSFLPGQ